MQLNIRKILNKIVAREIFSTEDFRGNPCGNDWPPLPSDILPTYYGNHPNYIDSTITIWVVNGPPLVIYVEECSMTVPFGAPPESPPQRHCMRRIYWRTQPLASPGISPGDLYNFEFHYDGMDCSFRSEEEQKTLHEWWPGWQQPNMVPTNAPPPLFTYPDEPPPPSIPGNFGIIPGANPNYTPGYHPNFYLPSDLDKFRESNPSERNPFPSNETAP